MSNLKIGGQNVGKIYLGDKLIMGGAVNQFVNNDIGGAPIVVINESGLAKRFSYDGYIENGSSVDKEIVIEPMQMALLFSPGNDDNLYALDSCKCDTYRGYTTLDDDIKTPYVETCHDKVYKQGDYIIGAYSTTWDDFSIVLIKE